MTITDVMKRLVKEKIDFRFVNRYGVDYIYIDGNRTGNGYRPQIRISVETGKIYRRNCSAIGFCNINTLLNEIRELK